MKDGDVKPEEKAEEEPSKEEAPAEDEGEKVEDKENKEEVEEENEKEETDTTPSEETSEQTEEKPEEKTEEDSDVPPPTEEEEATEEESAEDVEKVKAGLEDLGNLVQNVETEYNRVLNGIQKALNDTLDQYGIDKTKTLDELRKEDPAKAVIAEDLIKQANEVKQFNETNLTKQVQDKGAELVFKKAEKLFNKYTLSHEQAEVAADTFINIMMNVGVNDLGEDLAAKVELAAARAKLVVPDVVEAQVKDEAPVDAVEDVVDVPAAEDTAEEPKEENSKPEEKEEPEKPEVKVTVEKPSIDALKEGVADGDSGAANSNPITADNVLQVMASVPFKNRVQFYKDHEDLINEAARKRSR